MKMKERNEKHIMLLEIERLLVFNQSRPSSGWMVLSLYKMSKKKEQITNQKPKLT